MTETQKRHRGLTFTELTVALMVLGIILSCLAISLRVFSEFNKYLLIKQHCIYAASAVLDGATAAAEKINAEDMQRLWPDVIIATETTDGTGQWEGLKLLRVTAVGKMPHKKIKVELSRYILIGRER